MRLSLAPEGADVIISALLLFMVLGIASILFGKGALYILWGLSALWMIAALQFFRDPPREIKDSSVNKDKVIISPADGKIVAIGEPPFSPLDPPGKRVSIFMSPINVHVNRSPVIGVIEDVKHFEGKFLTAFRPEAERENERTLITMRTPHGLIAFSQVAGYLARRIVFHPQPGDSLGVGQRVGLIRFGSRVDLFIPEDVKILTKIGDKVTAGVTVIGEF